MISSSKESSLLRALSEALGSSVDAWMFDAKGQPSSGRSSTSLAVARANRSPGKVLLEIEVDSRGGRLVVEAPAERAAELEGLVAVLGEQFRNLDQLEQDMDSMNESSLAQMEGVAKLGHVVQLVSTCRTDQELASLALESLAVATSVERASFIRLLPQRGSCEVVAEFVIDERTNNYVPCDDGVGEAFLVTEGFLFEILDGRPTAIVDAERARAEAMPGTPGADAREAVLAVPVRYGDADQGETIGAIVLTDPRANLYASARQFGSQEAELAVNIASILGAAVGQRRFAAVDRELKLANEIQQQILPQGAAKLAGFDLAGRCETPGAIGGDYFDYISMADGRCLVFIADVSGHNLASGMVMVGARSSLRLLAGRESDPAAVMTGLHGAIFDDLSRTERFITAAGAALRAGDGEIELVNAGHNPPLLFRSETGEVEQLPGSDPILGLVPDLPFSSVRVQLQPGDALLLYTDGMTEATAPDGTMFEEERLAEVLRRSAAGPARGILDELFNSVRDFADESEAGDDITAVVVKFVGQAKP